MSGRGRGRGEVGGKEVGTCKGGRMGGKRRGWKREEGCVPYQLQLLDPPIMVIVPQILFLQLLLLFVVNMHND